MKTKHYTQLINTKFTSNFGRCSWGLHIRKPSVSNDFFQGKCIKVAYTHARAHTHRKLHGRRVFKGFH